MPSIMSWTDEWWCIAHPFLTPEMTSNPADCCLSAQTLHIILSLSNSSYPLCVGPAHPFTMSCLMILINLDAQQNVARSNHKPVQFMLSIALVKLINTMRGPYVVSCSFLGSVLHRKSCRWYHNLLCIATQEGPALLWLLLISSARLFQGLYLQLSAERFPCNSWSHFWIPYASIGWATMRHLAHPFQCPLVISFVKVSINSWVLEENVEFLNCAHSSDPPWCWDGYGECFEQTRR